MADADDGCLNSESIKALKSLLKRLNENKLQNEIKVCFYLASIKRLNSTKT